MKNPPILSGKLPALFAIALAAASCGTGGGGGGGGRGFSGTPCALDGSCPAGMTCGADQTYCVPADATGSGGAADADSSASPTDTGSTSGGVTMDSGSSSSGGTGDASTTLYCGSDGSCPVGMHCLNKVCFENGTDADGGSSGGDAGGSGGGSVGIAAIQKGAPSTVCADTKGKTKVLEATTLEESVATMDALKVGKNWVFYARPAGAPAGDGRWQGIKVFTWGGQPKVKAGDRLELKGDVLEYYCETELSMPADKVAVKGSGASPAPYLVAPSEIPYDGDAAEPYEGVLVALQNVKVYKANTLGSDGKTHGGFAVVAQSGGNAEVHVDLASASQYTQPNASTKDLETVFTQGQVFSSITGHLNYAFGEFVLLPRTDADLAVQ